MQHQVMHLPMPNVRRLSNNLPPQKIFVWTIKRTARSYFIFMVQNSRLIVGIGNNAKLQYWIKIHLFQFPSLKTFIESTDCGDIKPNYTLVSRNSSTYSIICNINYVQHQCDLNTLILSTFCVMVFMIALTRVMRITVLFHSRNTHWYGPIKRESCDIEILLYNGCADF